MRIYLDVCCLNRPFDDQTQDRLRFECEAILTILHRCEIGQWELVTSEVIDLEISKIPEDDRKRKVAILVSLSAHKILLRFAQVMEIPGTVVELIFTQVSSKKGFWLRLRIVYRKALSFIVI